MGELSELLSRVEQATGPDRAIDKALVEALGSVGPNGIPYCAAPLTSSIDAALALVERVLPGHRWGVHCHHSSRGEYRAHVTKRSPLRPMPNIADAPTAPLAVISALLHALSRDTP